MMMRYIDLDTLQLQRRLSGYPVEVEETKRNGIFSYSVQFVRSCVPEMPAMPNGASIYLVLKPRGRFNDPSLAFKLTGTVADGIVTFADQFFSPIINGLFAADPDHAECDLEIEWQQIINESSSAPQKTNNQVTLRIINCVKQGQEEIDYGPNYESVYKLTDVTRLTGGNPETDLDAIPIGQFAGGQIFEIAIVEFGAKVSSRWQSDKWLAHYAPVTNAAQGLIVTPDYNASTMPYILRRIEGA